MEQLLKVENLRVSYHSYAGEVQSVRGVSFEVNKGETVAVVGESGCGKSVTSKAIMGLIQCPPGEIKEGSHIYFENQDLLSFQEKQWEKYRGAECSMIFQDALTSLNPTMNIGNQIIENITNHKNITKLEAKKDEKTGRMNMVPVEGSEQKLDADLVLIAAGFLGTEKYVADAFGVKLNVRTNVETEEGRYKTNVKKVFTAGDMHRGQLLVVWAIREGREAAREVDESLMGYSYLSVQ